MSDVSNQDNLQDEEWFKHIQSRLKQIKYGSIQLVVHNGKIMQIECTEKIRLGESN